MFLGFLGDEEAPEEAPEVETSGAATLAPLLSSGLFPGDANNAREARKSARKTTTTAAVGGAVAGGTIGMALGPLGALVGAVVGGAGGGIYGLITGKKQKKKVKKKEQQAMQAAQAAQASERQRVQLQVTKELAEKTRLRSLFYALRSKADNILRQLQQRLSSIKTTSSKQYTDENQEVYEDDFSQLIEFFELYKEELEDIVEVGEEHLVNGSASAEAGDGVEDAETELQKLSLQLDEIKTEINVKLSEYRPMYVQTGNLNGLGGLEAMLGDGCGASCDCSPCKAGNYGSNGGQSGNSGAYAGGTSLSGLRRGLSGDELGDWLAETRSKNRKALGLPPLARGLSGLDEMDIGTGLVIAGAIAAIYVATRK